MFLIIDGNNLAHRCKHVFSLSNNGTDVSVTYGFIRVLSSLMNKFKPTSVFVAWDGGIPEYRREAVPEYKANRHVDEDPFAYEDFIRQMQELSDYALPIMGMVCARKVGVEADDLMYHAAKLSTDKEIIIVSGDADMLQAINGNIRVYSPSREKLYDAKTFEEDYGFEFSVGNYIDWRALQGDGSDNIPGVYGIGEKTATKLITKYGDISKIFNAACGRLPEDNLTGKIAERIQEFGIERLFRNVKAMALYADRIGSRQEIYESTSAFMKANRKLVKIYFMKNAFVSLMDGSLYKSIEILEKPSFVDETKVRVPIVCNRRFPI